MSSISNYSAYIKENVNIVDVVSMAGVALQHNKACCPFHNEKTASFSIHPKKNIYKCFGCGAGGDVISFVQRFYGLDFMGAVSRLNSDYCLGLELDRKKNHQSEEYKAYKRERTIQRMYADKFKRFETALIIYRRKLYRYIMNYIPPSELSDFSEEYTKAIHNINIADYYCDIMAYGTFEDKKNLINSERVKAIERSIRGIMS